MLSEFLKNKLIHFFKLLDQDGNGHWQLEDFSEIAERLRMEFGFTYESKENKFLVDRCVNFFYKLLGNISHSGEQTISEGEWLKYADRALVNSSNPESLDDFIEFMVGFFFDLFDENHDGYISAEEYADLFLIYKIDIKYSAKAFINLDINRDGRLSRTELLYAFETFITSDEKETKGNWIFGFWQKG